MINLLIFFPGTLGDEITSFADISALHGGSSSGGGGGGKKRKKKGLGKKRGGKKKRFH